MNELFLIDGFGGSPTINWQADIERYYQKEFDIHTVEYSNATDS
ncbi:hypothetical protein SFC66_06550 [Terribacillus saccharophilus]